MRLLLVVALISSLLPATGAVECVCLQEPSPSQEKVKANRKQAYNEATAVFAGKVVALDPYTVKFRLEKRWKGDSGAEVLLSTGAVPGFDGSPLPEECSYQFHLSEEYLVYTYGAAEKMKANSCLTLLIKNAAAEENGLDEITLHKVIRETVNE